MTRRNHFIVSCVVAGALIAGAAAVAARPPMLGPRPGPPDVSRAPKHQLPVSAKGNLTVGLCDGETAVEVKGVKAGQALDPSQARVVADELMDQWRRKNPGVPWDGTVLVAEERGTAADKAGRAVATTTTQSPPSASPSASPSSAGGMSTAGETASAGARQAPEAEAAHTQGASTYGNYSERDRQIWTASMDAFIQRGKHVFHDVKELGGTTGISCDMCHPDGANTHPETYPKYQVQLGRVALLRDMINWCIENPVRGKALPDGADKMRALEAYIYAQRKGIALDSGKH